MHVFATPIVPASIRQGYTTYIMRRWDQKEYIESIHKYQITETWLPPPPLITIPQDPLATKDKLRSVRQIWMGGAGVTYENQKPLYDLLHPDARINQVWGMTETGWVSQVHWPKKQCDNSVGTTLKGCRVRYVMPFILPTSVRRLTCN
jgi:4-coumarate--CoA ligase